MSGRKVISLDEYRKQLSESGHDNVTRLDVPWNAEWTNFPDGAVLGPPPGDDPREAREESVTALDRAVRRKDEP